MPSRPPMTASNRMTNSSVAPMTGSSRRITAFQHIQSRTGWWSTHQARRTVLGASLLRQWGQKEATGTS